MEYLGADQPRSRRGERQKQLFFFRIAARMQSTEREREIERADKKGWHPLRKTRYCLQAVYTQKEASCTRIRRIFYTKAINQTGHSTSYYTICELKKEI